MAEPPPAGSERFSRAGTDCRQIEQILAHLHGQHPEVQNLAARSGLSEAHLQRLFKRWAGVDAQGFLESLRPGHARQRMAQTADLLYSGMSTDPAGTGHPHKPPVTLEAVPPDAFRAKPQETEAMQSWPKGWEAPRKRRRKTTCNSKPRWKQPAKVASLPASAG